MSDQNQQIDWLGDHPRQRKPTATELRDISLRQVRDNSGPWFGRAISAIATIERGWTGIGEDVRHHVEGKIGKPHHHNAHGSLIRQAIKLHLLVPTGEWVHMKDEKSNARRTPVYRKT